MAAKCISLVAANTNADLANLLAIGSKCSSLISLQIPLWSREWSQNSETFGRVSSASVCVAVNVNRFEYFPQ